MHLEHSKGVLDLSRPRIMAVLNVTPDSFYDGGRYVDVRKAVDRALYLEDVGADIIDIGGESTRPGSKRVSEEEEKRRVLPVIEKIVDRVHIPIAIDTYKPSVAREACQAGASIINDVTACRFNPEMFDVVKEFNTGLVLMHSIWPPETMQQNPQYNDVVKEVKEFLLQRAEAAKNAGISRYHICIDPGIGFGKTLEHNLKLLANLKELVSTGYPVLVGPSRKSFIGLLTDKPAEQRLFGTAAAVSWCVANGATIVRVHDPEEMKDVVRVTAAIAQFVSK